MQSYKSFKEIFLKVVSWNLSFWSLLGVLIVIKGRLVSSFKSAQYLYRTEVLSFLLSLPQGDSSRNIWRFSNCTFGLIFSFLCITLPYMYNTLIYVLRYPVVLLMVFYTSKKLFSFLNKLLSGLRITGLRIRILAADHWDSKFAFPALHYQGGISWSILISRNRECL